MSGQWKCSRMNCTSILKNTSNKTTSPLMLFLCLLTLSLCSGCGAGGEEALLVSTPALGSNSVLVDLSIEPDRLVLAKGTTTTLSVTGLYSDGRRGPVVGVQFSSSDQTVATVSEGGIVTSASPGQTTITASAGKLSVSTLLTVTSATLNGIELSATPNSVAAGTTGRFQVTGFFTDDSSQDLTSAADITLGSAIMVEIPSPGVFRGLVAGDTTLTAEIGGFSDSLNLTVTPAVLESIRLLSAEADERTAVTKDGTLELTVIGHFSDGSEQSVTDGVSFTATPVDAVVFAPIVSGEATVEVTGVRSGPVEVTASAVVDNAISDSLSLTVLEAVPPPALVVESNVTFDTDTGELDGSALVGWNADDHRLTVQSLTINTGATLTLVGSQPFVLESGGPIKLDGVLDGGANNVEVQLYALGLASTESPEVGTLSISGTLTTATGLLHGANIKLVSTGNCQLGNACLVTADGTGRAAASEGRIEIVSMADIVGGDGVTLTSRGGGEVVVSSFGTQTFGDGLCVDVSAQPSVMFSYPDGGAGGRVVFQASEDQTFGLLLKILAYGTNGTEGNSRGGNGGAGGSVLFEADGSQTVGSAQIEAQGGRGGNYVNGGGAGRDGGAVGFTAGGSQTLGAFSIMCQGGNGGSQSGGGDGGASGRGGRVEIESGAAQVVADFTVFAAGGNGGSSDISGIPGKSGGQVILQAVTSQGFTGATAIDANGGAGGSSDFGTAGPGGSGGTVNFESFAVGTAGSVSANGGSGGTGGNGGAVFYPPAVFTVTVNGASPGGAMGTIVP